MNKFTFVSGTLTRHGITSLQLARYWQSNTSRNAVSYTQITTSLQKFNFRIIPAKQ